MPDVFYTQGPRSTTDSIAEGRMKVDAGVGMKKKKRALLKKMVKKACP